MWANSVVKQDNNPISMDQLDLVRPHFDIDFYRLQLSVRQLSVIDEISHYLTDGWKLNLDPSPYFSTEFYLSKYEDIVSSDMNPYLHYIMAGKVENRETSLSYLLQTTDENLEFQRQLVQAYFDADWYTASYPKVDSLGIHPLEHFLKVGYLEGLNPTGDFSTVEYRSKHLKDGYININPLVHFAMFNTGHQSCIQTEVILRKNDIKNVELENKLKRNSIIGNIDGLNDGSVYGWFLAPSDEAIPFLFVNEQPVSNYNYPVVRPDVNKHLGITGDTGFVFDVGGIEKGSNVELYVLCNNELVHVASHSAETNFLEENFMLQLNKAHKISQEPDAVAITCWEGSHNPIGRAKALYDVVSSKRPAIIITYSFSTFGNRTWEPIRGENICILTIPWATRSIYEQAIHSAGIKFETVWIGKGRFPSFELAKLISNDSSSLILDFDDNEEHFSKSDDAKSKAYGHTTINYSRYLIDKIASRTAASITLKNDFRAEVVRHARFFDENRTERKRHNLHEASDTKIKVGFIGTVRQHKNLTDAARGIKSFNWSSEVPAELHVYGDVNPPTLLTELHNNGVVVKGNIPMAELYKELGEMDVILTGFPSNDESANEINKYQISSKIGDALSVGRPALVPDGPSVADLHETPGVFLFNATNFSNKLAEAIQYTGNISLTNEFTIDGAYSAFSAAEKLAIESSSAKSVFSILPDKYSNKTAPPKTLVLLWKQNDSGFYGRRVDQIARSYKRLQPANRVIILELMSEETEAEYIRLAENYTSEHRLLLEQVPDKRKENENEDGVEIHQLTFENGPIASDQMKSYLLDNSILPMNSVFIIFPIVHFYEYIEPSIRAFPKVVDVVDNQFYWGTKNQQNYRISQYHMLLRSSDSIVFNSQRNRDYFVDNNVVSNTSDCHVIPNWYELPTSYKHEDRRDKAEGSRNIIYSGNMNDRIDWSLLERIADISDNTTVHLVGTVSHSIDKLSQLLEKENVLYHGPLSERDTLRLTQSMDLAIMPHSFDGTSAYMNPLKLKMYQTLGIQTISTDVPGIQESELVKICKNHNEFLDALQKTLEKYIHRSVCLDGNTHSTEYVQVIDALMRTKDQKTKYERKIVQVA
ncbi:MAG: glycosyltransferase [Granulosicoccus sp.]